MNRLTRYWIIVLVLVVIPCFNSLVRGFVSFAWGKVRGGYSVEERLAYYGPAVRSRLRESFVSVGLDFPPQEIAYLVFKDTRRLEVYARNSPEQAWRFIIEYPVRGASGKLGPKRIEGDHQVPEGIYQIELLNPNSRYHLSIRINYPNEFDKQMAQADGRTNLGGDIMIHGGSSSIGCLAMGDQTAEDLFVLAAMMARGQPIIIISPTDFRVSSAKAPLSEPVWVKTLYSSIRNELQKFPRGN